MFHGASSWSRNTSRFLFVLLPFMPMPCSISLPVLPHVSPTRLNSRLDGVGGGEVVQVPLTALAGEGGGKAVVAPSLALRDVRRGLPLSRQRRGGKARSPTDWKSSQEPRWLLVPGSAISPQRPLLRCSGTVERPPDPEEPLTAGGRRRARPPSPPPRAANGTKRRPQPSEDVAGWLAPARDRLSAPRFPPVCLSSVCLSSRSCVSAGHGGEAAPARGRRST